MSRVEGLSPRDIQVIGACLSAAVDGSYFREWEFHTLMGRRREEVAAVLATWPIPTDDDEQDLVANNVLNNLLGYPHGEWDELRKRIGADEGDVANLLMRWWGEDGAN